MFNGFEEGGVPGDHLFSAEAVSMDPLVSVTLYGFGSYGVSDFR